MWSGGEMVLGKLQVPGRPTIWMIVAQGPAALAVGAAGVVWTFLLSSIFSFLSRLKYCLKGPLSPKQPTKTQDFSNMVFPKERKIAVVCFKRTCFAT